uniref:Histone-lysine N-methyltransferase SETD1A-like n=1 Tax=Nicotiana tabacum TaxID=4097 RepID=A0A1S4BLT7_TOBAC
PDPSVPASPTAQAPQCVPSESSDGSAAGSDESSTSPTASVFGESAEGGTNSDDEVPDSGVPQSVPQPVQVPQPIEDALKEILANQQKILDSQDALAKALREDVDKLKADQMPLDLLFGDPAPAAAPVPQPQQEQEQALRPPRKKRKLPSSVGAVIELADPQETPSSDAPIIQPIQEQAPVPAAEQLEIGNQYEVSVHTEDLGTTDDPMQTNQA